LEKHGATLQLMESSARAIAPTRDCVSRLQGGGVRVAQNARASGRCGLLK